MSRTLLIDADIIAYQASSTNQRSYDWGDGEAAVVADFSAAKAQAADTIEELMDNLGGTDLVICLSDDIVNFRKRIDPSYKSNRATAERPEHLYALKDWLSETYCSRALPTLEADDVMGILSTEPHSGDRIIVSADKDMKTIPGLLYRPQEASSGIVEISLAAADRYHLYQTLIGDSTDGYPGCPGIGPAKTTAILDECMGWEPHEYVFTRGPRKGQFETRWASAKFSTPWEAIVSAFERAGLKEKDALVQARLARILRHDEYNGRPILWNPT